MWNLIHLSTTKHLWWKKNMLFVSQDTDVFSRFIFYIFIFNLFISFLLFLTLGLRIFHADTSQTQRFIRRDVCMQTRRQATWCRIRLIKMQAMTTGATRLVFRFSIAEVVAHRIASRSVLSQHSGTITPLCAGADSVEYVSIDCTSAPIKLPGSARCLTDLYARSAIM